LRGHSWPQFSHLSTKSLNPENLDSDNFLKCLTADISAGSICQQLTTDAMNSRQSLAGGNKKPPRFTTTPSFRLRSMNIGILAFKPKKPPGEGWLLVL